MYSGVGQCKSAPGPLQHMMWDVKEHRPVHHPLLLDHVVVLHDCLGEPEPGGCILLPETRQLHLVWDCMLLQGQEPVHYPVLLHLLRVPGGRVGIASASGRWLV